MGRTKRKHGHKATDDEERWKSAITVPVDGGLSFQVQVVGIDSPTGTLFVRRDKTDTTTLQSEEQASPPLFYSIENVPAFRVVLERVFAVTIPQQRLTSSCCPTSSEETVRELCRIGAIWISTKDSSHPHNPPKWKRASESQLEQQVMLEDDVIIRIHSRPSRFPSFSKLKVVSKSDAHGFWIVNKPGGCPSHATVDNAIENALAVVQQHSSYATLPQRLDTETSGLLLVATKPDFARYICRLLEAKTNNSKRLEESREQLVESKSIKSLIKKYRCLVVVSNLELHRQLYQWKDSRYCVTHYLDTTSSVPKRFISNVPDQDEIISSPEAAKKWQRCQLRIASVSQPYPVSIPIRGPSNGAENLYEALWGEHPKKPDGSRNNSPNKYVLELEIDLLTGRTHQIRGQLSALGAPIVGDFLYGLDKKQINLNDANARASIRMALQCCSLEFQKPENAQESAKDEISNSDCTFYRFHLDHAWWTEYLQQYGKEEP